MTVVMMGETSLDNWDEKSGKKVQKSLNGIKMFAVITVTVTLLVE